MMKQVETAQATGKKNITFDCWRSDGPPDPSWPKQTQLPPWHSAWLADWGYCRIKVALGQTLISCTGLDKVNRGACQFSFSESLDNIL